jgi:aminopeptidase YwaD
LRIVTPALIALLLAFGACGDDGGGDTPTATRAPTPSPTATRAATPTPAPTATVTPDPAFSAARAMAHVNALAGNIGIRAPGTDGERMGAEYVRDQLASYGYEATLQPFPIQIFESLDVRLEAGGVSFTPSLLDGSASANIEAQLVEAGIGQVEGFPDASGRIALIERGTITFGEKVANAQAAGAIGVVVYNNVDGPFTGNLGQGQPAEIPAVAISRTEGLQLRDMIADGVTARLVAEARFSDGESRNVIARPAGGDCSVIAGGHYDSVQAGPGANDNGSGTAVVLELARTLAARGDAAGVCFVLFGAEEAGLLGSAFYVSQLSEGEREAILGMLNFDMLGVGTDWPFSGTTSMVDLAGQAAEALGIPYRISGEPPGVGSDHASFIAEDIPAILFNCFCDPNYHTAADRPEFVIEERLGQAGGIGLGMLEALLTGG